MPACALKMRRMESGAHSKKRNENNCKVIHLSSGQYVALRAGHVGSIRSSWASNLAVSVGLKQWPRPVGSSSTASSYGLGVKGAGSRTQLGLNSQMEA